ncbi:hypothetical protein ALC57_14830 [Trachymyrmex cornetzi]|uniref:Uncharacterized protein n=1 Tax=Trachymyrmex cornetzi TaxID=471704 RepID=A0A151IXL5_9HYME|nr:hypothetical protein ALC57_14830 [Trachymyrmex cornetzi]
MSFSCARFITRFGRKSLVRERGANTASSYRIGTLRVVENSVARVNAGHSTGPGLGVMCVYTESCKCDAYAMLVWPMTSSALPMTFTATTPCPCSSGVHPGQASTSLITKDSVNDPANYIFRAG